MATMTLTLPDPMKDFLEDQAARQGFATVSDYLQSVIREVQGEPADRDRVDALLLEGLDSGPATPMTPEDWDEIRREGDRLIAERRNARS